jgi:hypothetical protein
LSGNAYAEIIYLNCKFVNGSLEDLKNNISESIDYSEDVTIDLDLKNNKVLNGPHLGLNSDPSIYDEEDEISWQNEIGTPDNGVLNIVNLNRRNGSLKIWTIFNLKPNHGSEYKYYKCRKTEKKLF